MQILLASTQISNNQSLAFPILLRTVQSEISCVHHLFSVNYTFLFFVVRLRLVGIFERIAKILQFLKKISDHISISSNRRK